MTTLVNDMLDLSKMQSGAQKLSPSFFDLTESVRDILGRYNKLTDYDIRFTADRDVTVYADELKISQVVYNLVNNAITYTGEDKVVRLKQSEHDGKVRIEVRDTGEGIDQDKLKDIWERYYLSLIHICITLRKKADLCTNGRISLRYCGCSFGAVRFGFCVCSFVLVRHMGFRLMY